MSSLRRLVTATTTGVVVAVSLPLLAAAPAQAGARCPTVLPEATPAVDLVVAGEDLPQQPANTALVSDLTDTVEEAAQTEAEALTSPDPGGDGGAAAGAVVAPELWLDTCGKAFYVDTDSVLPEAATPEQGATAGAEGGATVGTDTQLAALTSTFTLHSKPGSTKTIYLDFDGYTLANTAWNEARGVSSVNLPGYDSDGSPSSFSDAEKIAIQNVWAIVAEDYSAFDVDVTTQVPAAGVLERSGSGDNTYGARAVVTGDVAGQSSCGCGGIAYLGVFNDYTNHEYYQPALAYTRGVGTSAKNVAEVISHEVGHNLGLSHQGTGSAGYYLGHTPWAPIMGAGYYQPVTQWAQGEYVGANNHQDELGTIAAYGASTRTDDHGDTAGTATALPGPLSGGVTRSGVISGTSDVDAFTFTLDSSATVDIEALADQVAPDLDVDLRVLNSNGTVVATANPATVATSSSTVSGMDASFDALPLSSGTYTVTVDGSGYANPSSTGYSGYGSLGTYDLTVTAAYNDAPQLGTTSLPVATSSVTYSTQLEATSDYGPVTWSLYSGKLPSGLKLSTSGLLSGRTTWRSPVDLVLKAADSRGVFTLTAVRLDLAGPVAASSLTVVKGVAGTAFASQVKISGGTAPYTVTVDAKPDWASVSSAGEITGTPLVAENAVLSLTVTDASGRAKSGTYKVAIDGPLRIETTALPYDSTVLAGTSNSVKLVAVGGSKRYTWDPAASTLPTGATLSKAGTVTFKGLAVGDYEMTVAVADSLGATATQTLAFSAVPAVTLDIHNTPITVGEPFDLWADAAGGKGWFDYTITGAPAGWFSDWRWVFGVPTSTKRVTLKVTATDSTGRSLAKTVSLTPRAVPVVSTSTLAAATTGVTYSSILRATGGSGRYVWSLENGVLPAGVILKPTGQLYGKPTETGSFPLVLRATDTEGRLAFSTDLVLGVSAAITMSTPSALGTTVIGQPYELQLDATGGAGGFTYTGSYLPYGLRVSPTGLISGTPTLAGRYTMRIYVRDAAGRSVMFPYTLQVTYP